MDQTINITISEQTAHLIEQIADKNNISNFVEDAIKHYMKHAGKINLREQIKQGALKRAERDLKLTQEWNRLSNLSKAFLDKDGNAVIETGLGFKGDVT